MAAIVDTTPTVVEEPKEVAAVAAEPAPISERVVAGFDMLSKQLESQSLNALTSGFFFAAALAWMDVSRSVIGQFVKGNKNGVLPMTLTALATTLLSIVVFMIISSVSPRVERPTAPVYAVVGR